MLNRSQMGNRNIPMIASVCFGVSPLTTDEKKRYFYVGAMVGAYVPFLDF